MYIHTHIYTHYILYIRSLIQFYGMLKSQDLTKYKLFHQIKYREIYCVHFMKSDLFRRAANTVSLKTQSFQE